MKTKSRIVRFGLFLASALVVPTSFAGPPTLRSDAPALVDGHLHMHKELAPFANRYGWKRAMTYGRCTSDGQYVEQRNQAYFNHCRDYAGNDGITRRIVYNDKQGNDAAQRIYELHPRESKLVVTFQDAVVVADSTGTVSPGVTAPGVATRPETPEDALRNLVGTIRRGIKP